MTRADATVHVYEEGSVNDGTAVLVSGDAAYWVKDGVVYAANGTAKTWSPALAYAPTGVDYATVRAGVQ